MINGAHFMIYSENPEADRAFFREVLGLPHIDVGEGWLIFGLPPAEIAIHPADQEPSGAPHSLYLMTHDVEALVETLDLRGTATTPIQDEGWGLVTEITLPGGGQLPVYQARHERPDFATAGTRKPRSGASSSRKARPVSAAKKSAKKAAKKSIKKTVKRATRGAKVVRAPKVSKPVRKAPKRKAAKGSKKR